jgi:predicted DNA binding protein
LAVPTKPNNNMKALTEKERRVLESIAIPVLIACEHNYDKDTGMYTDGNDIIISLTETELETLRSAIKK